MRLFRKKIQTLPLPLNFSATAETWRQMFRDLAHFPVQDGQMIHFLIEESGREGVVFLKIVFEGQQLAEYTLRAAFAFPEPLKAATELPKLHLGGSE